jgi:hypothetical protein
MHSLHVFATCLPALQFLRSALSPEACVDVVLLAQHYHCSALQSEGVSGCSALSCL